MKTRECWVPEAKGNTVTHYWLSHPILMQLECTLWETIRGGHELSKAFCLPKPIGFRELKACLTLCWMLANMFERS